MLKTLQVRTLFNLLCIFSVSLLALCGYIYTWNDHKPTSINSHLRNKSIILSNNKTIDLSGDKIVGDYIKISTKNVKHYQILYLATTFFSDEQFRYTTTSKRIFRLPKGCHEQYQRCVLTRNPAYESIAAASISHWRDFYLEEPELPDNSFENTTRPSIVFNFESPINTRSYALPEDSSFHLIAGYRLDSDIVSVYGETLKLPEKNLSFAEIDYWTGKRKPAAWMVSNCVTEGRREKYIRHLKRHLSVDVYGNCEMSRFDCPKTSGNNAECLSYASKHYFFYLAFENSIYEDYITEKVWNLGEHRMIPVVYGGANYTKHLPPKSFIDATLYRPKELANVLKRIMKDKDEYNSYFAWKTDYVFVNYISLDHLYCKVCETIQDSNRVYQPKNGSVINDWYFVPPNKKIRCN